MISLNISSDAYVKLCHKRANMVSGIFPENKILEADFTRITHLGSFLLKGSMDCIEIVSSLKVHKIAYCTNL